METSSTPFDRTAENQRRPQAPPDQPTERPPNRKALTIGAVAKILGREFEDVSISKIRYLEDQKLLSPRRTPGGYRLYSQADVERLRAILRMQRDEFLPLRVIRQELAAGAREERGATAPRSAAPPRSRPARAPRLTLEELVDQTGVAPELIKELEDCGIVQPEHSRARSSTTTPTARSSRPRGARPLRRRRAQPEGVPHLGRPRGGAARGSGRGRRFAPAATTAPQGGDREPGEPRRRLQQPHAHAARPRPAEADRRGVGPALARSCAGAASPRPRARVWARGHRPVPPAALVAEHAAGRGRAARRGRRTRSWTQVLETREGRGVRADYRCVARDRRRALRLRAGASRGRRSSASCARPDRDHARAAERRDRGDEPVRPAAAGPLAARLADDAPGDRRARSNEASTGLETGRDGREGSSLTAGR